ncbi:MAG: peptide deformylase [Comamonas sp.]
MAVREIIRMGDARLLRIAQPVAEFDRPELHELVADLWDTMASAGGVGLAAPQVAVDLQVIVFGTGQPVARYPREAAVPPTVLINPRIEPLGDEQEEGWEGCLSIPGLRGAVPRWRRIRYQGRDAHGQWIEREAEGFHARVVQHEYDHLVGTLYPMRIQDFSRFGYTDVLFPELA